MKKIFMTLSILGLVILVAFPMMQVAELIDENANLWGIATGTVLWFAMAPLWMRPKKD